MESEYSNPSSSSSGRSRSGGGRSDGRSGRHRRRRRRHKHKRSSPVDGLKKGLLRFCQKNKSWLLGLLGIVTLIAILLLTFSLVERQAINAAHASDR